MKKELQEKYEKEVLAELAEAEWLALPLDVKVRLVAEKKKEIEKEMREIADEIEKIKKPSIYIVILKNGDEHHFLSRAVYDRWCRGRTYMIGDTLYRSELPFKNDWKN